MEVNTVYYQRWRAAHFMEYGRTQELKAEYGGTTAFIKDCQFVSKEHQMDYDPKDYL